MANASTVDILVRSAADVRALDLAVKRLQDLQTAATAVAGALANITQPLSQVLRAASEAQVQTVDAVKAAAQAVQDIGKATAAAQQQTAAAAQKAAQVAKAAEAESAKGVEKLQSRRRELADLTRKERDEAFKKLPVEEQLNQLLARRATIADRLVRAGENEGRSLALRIAQARNETAIRAAQARIVPQATAVNASAGPVGFGQGFRLGFGIDISRRIVDGVLQLNAAIKNTIREGIAFNATLEDSALGIAAVLKQFNPQQFANFDEALRASEGALESLKRKALESPASFAQLVQSFQAVTGAATSAGIALDKQVDLIVLMSQALAGLGIRNDQIVQESRALLTGNITEDAAAARILQITKQQVDAARESGKLFEFLTSRLSAFAEAGRRGAENFTTRLSNVRDAVVQLAAELSKPLFETLKREFGELEVLLADPKFRENVRQAIKPILDAAQSIASAISEIVKAAAQIGTLSSYVLEIGSFALAVAGLSKGFNLLKAAAAFSLAPFALSATAVISPVTLAAAAIVVLVAAYRALKEGIAAYQAQQQQLVAEESLSASTTNLLKTIKEQIELREKLGEIDAKRANDLRDQVAHLEKERSLYGEQLTNDFAREIARDVRGGDAAAAAVVPPQVTAAQREAARKLALTKAQVETSINLEKLTLEELQDKESYARREITLDDYLTRQADRVAARTAEQTRLLKQQQIGAGELEQTEIGGQIGVLERQREQELFRIKVEGEAERRRLEEDSAAARIQYLEITGQQLLAEEARIQQQLTQLRQQGAAESDIAAIERLMTARAKANAELEKTRGIQGDYSLRVAETNRLVQSGMITQTEAARRNDTAAREYEAALRKVLAVLLEIQEANPDLSGIIDDIRELQAEIASAPPPTQEEDLSFGKGATDYLKSGIIDLENEAAIAGRIMQGTIGSAVNGIGDAITGLITRTATWGQVFAQVGVQIVSTLVKIGVEMIAQAALSKVLSLGAKTEAATTGASITSSMAPAAATTSAATFGGNTASIALTIAAIVAAIAAISSLAFAEGGLVPGAPSSRDNRIAAVATGEFINRAAAVQYYGPGVFQALNEMRIPRASLDHMRVPVRPSLSAGFATGGLVGPMPSIGSGATNVNVAPAPVHVYYIDDLKKFEQLMEGRFGERMVVMHASNNKNKIGIPS